MQSNCEKTKLIHVDEFMVRLASLISEFVGEEVIWTNIKNFDENSDSYNPFGTMGRFVIRKTPPSIK